MMGFTALMEKHQRYMEELRKHDAFPELQGMNYMAEVMNVPKITFHERDEHLLDLIKDFKFKIKPIPMTPQLSKDNRALHNLGAQLGHFQDSIQNDTSSLQKVAEMLEKLAEGQACGEIVGIELRVTTAAAYGRAADSVTIGNNTVGLPMVLPAAQKLLADMQLALEAQLLATATATETVGAQLRDQLSAKTAA